MSRPTFTHASFLDPTWIHGPGETYRDAPPALMEVTTVTRRTVFYGYAGATTGLWRMDIADFEARYPGVLR